MTSSKKVPPPGAVFCTWRDESDAVEAAERLLFAVKGVCRLEWANHHAPAGHQVSGKTGVAYGRTGAVACAVLTRDQGNNTVCMFVNFVGGPRIYIGDEVNLLKPEADLRRIMKGLTPSERLRLMMTVADDWCPTCGEDRKACTCSGRREVKKFLSTRSPKGNDMIYLGAKSVENRRRFSALCTDARSEAALMHLMATSTNPIVLPTEAKVLKAFVDAGSRGLNIEGYGEANEFVGTPNFRHHAREMLKLGILVVNEDQRFTISELGKDLWVVHKKVQESKPKVGAAT